MRCSSYDMSVFFISGLLLIFMITGCSGGSEKNTTDKSNIDSVSSIVGQNVAIDAGENSPVDAGQSFPVDREQDASAELLASGEPTLAAAVPDENEVLPDTGSAVVAEKLESGGDFWANLDASGVQDNRDGVFSFPGATGYGRYSEGGRGGRVYCVNTLDDINMDRDGKISYREAVTGINEVSSGNRIVTFCVAGEIDTGEERVLILQGNLTVACQTAPAPGVVITGYRPVDIDNDADHQIWRHCDLKPRDTLDASKNTSQRIITIGGGAGTAPDHLMFDHLSLMYSTDDSFVVYVNRDPATTVPSNITLSHSIIAEGDTTCLRSDFECGNAESRRTDDYRWPNHSMGPAVSSHNGTPVTGVSIIANVIGNTNARNPQFRGVSPGEIANNIMFNVHSAGVTISSPANTAPNDVYVEGNIIKEGPDDRKTDHITYQSANTRAAVGRNIRIDWEGDVTTDYQGNGVTILEGMTRAYSGGSNQLDLSCVGSSRPARDSEDERIIAEINGTGTNPVLASAEVGIGPRIDPIVPPCVAGARCFYEPAIDDQGQRDYSSYVISATHPDTYDTDEDGIADAWERLAIAADFSGALLSLSDIDFQTDADSDGYLDVEEWLNYLARCPE